jgi:multidrug resistance efflux pump
MNARKLAIVLGIVLIAAVELGRAIPIVSAAKDAPEENLDVRYAQAQLELAQANLRKVERANERFPKTLSAFVIGEYARDLAIAKAQLENAKRGGDAEMFQTWLERAQSNVKSAESIYENALSTNRRQPNSVDSLDLERLRLRLEVMRLQLQRGQSLAAGSHEQKMQWQITVLNDEVARLKEQTSRISPQNRLYPWRY